MNPRIPLLFALLFAAFSFAGCEDEGIEMGPAANCDLDLNNLQGDWISLKGGEGGKDTPDKFARVRFETVDGKKIAHYTAGKLHPDNPATDKYIYEFVEVTQQGDAFYRINLIKGKSEQRIERLKKDNRRLDMKFEGRLYIKIDKRQCALRIGDMYATWVKGEEYEDTNPAGWRTYMKSPVEYSYVNCDEPGMLLAFDTSEPDAKSQPLALRDGLYAAEDSHFFYDRRNSYDQDLSDEEKQKKGLIAKDGCTYDYEIWMADVRVKDAQKIPVKPNEDGSITWYYKHVFPKSSALGIFTEMHRYATCGGKRELLGNACTAVWPNRARSESAPKKGEDKKK